MSSSSTRNIDVARLGADFENLPMNALLKKGRKKEKPGSEQFHGMLRGGLVPSQQSPHLHISLPVQDNTQEIFEEI